LPVDARNASFDDAALIAQVLSGDTAAFEPLMRRYNRVLYRTARSIVKDDAEAEDALQEAYLQAYRSLSAFRAESRLLTWLTRIVVNAAVARLRKSARRAQIIRLDCDMEPNQEPEQDPRQNREHYASGNTADGGQVEQPEQAAMRAETRRLLEQKLDQLPEAFRTVFVLREMEEMSVEEVSAALGIPEATVRTRHFRGRSMLRESLSREMDIALGEAFGFDGERCDRIVAGVLQRLPDAGDEPA
jgi:RNA polymerase sigma-70 factor (ECF subfamily)